MSDVYVAPKSRVANPKARLMVAQTADWQIEHDHLSKQNGVRFKVTDKRDESRRIADGGALRRVWNVTYNSKGGYFGGDDGFLREVYPDMAAWMHAEIAAYCIANGLSPQKVGRKPAKKNEQPEGVA